MNAPILQPVIVLVLWSLVMWAWLYATRIPAMQKAKIQLDPNAMPAHIFVLRRRDRSEKDFEYFV